MGESGTIYSTLSINDGIPLGTNTAGRLKQKIGSGQFIEFKSLLSDNKKTTVSIKIDPKKYMYFKYRFCKKSKFDLNWSVDNSLPSFYGYLYWTKTLGCPSSFLNRIQLFGKSQPIMGMLLGRYYEGIYRKLRQSNNLPRQTTVSELLVSACTFHRAKQPFRFSFRNKSDKFSKVCFNFNNNSNNNSIHNNNEEHFDIFF